MFIPNWEIFIIFISGFVLGALIVSLISWRFQKSARQLADELNRQTQIDKIREMEKIIDQLRASFGDLSLQALSKSTDAFLKLANQTFNEQSRRGEENLQSKKALIDQNLTNMKQELTKVQDLMNKLQQERKEEFGKINEKLENTATQTQKLQETANQLNKALSHSQIRGQWGERMAEDVLRMAGMIEGINYIKQKATYDNTRPDFTFMLPNDFRVNMDVKFPLTNYLEYLNEENKTEKIRLKGQFLKDVRQRILEVSNKNYINPQDKTLDYMIVFIPNEQVYSFINQNDKQVLDLALEKKVILSSLLTLYAILAVIRQAVENFSLEQTAAEILNLLGEFNSQWSNFKNSMEVLGKRIDSAQREFQHLFTVRSNKLEKPLLKIDSLRQENQIYLNTSKEEESN